ncbi:hypothetical protein GQ56_0113275 [Burkholderia paludis]|nr:hypothetical protein GQ56_0113275 [Burkholderia paludis]
MTLAAGQGADRRPHDRRRAAGCRAARAALVGRPGAPPPGGMTQPRVLRVMPTDARRRSVRISRVIRRAVER